MRRSISTVLLILAVIFSIFIGGCGSSKTANDMQKSERSQSGAPDSVSPAQPQEKGTLGNTVSMDRKITQQANLQMKVQNVAAVVDQIIAISSQNGGYTVNSHIYRDNKDTELAQLKIKVPQANLLPVIASISAFGEVTDKVIAVEDVTEEYYDSQARLKVLKAKEERLLGLMDRAANITEIINVENELSKTRSEIEVLSGRMQYLTNVTEYSLINVTLKQGIPGTVQAPQGTWGKAWQGLISSLNGVINFASGTVVFLITSIPWLVILIILGLLGRYLYKKARAKQPKE